MEECLDKPKAEDRQEQGSCCCADWGSLDRGPVDPCSQCSWCGICLQHPDIDEVN